MLKLGIREILILIAALTLSLGIVVPIYGIIVRFRANYNPRALQLDNEGGAHAHTGPIVRSLFAMARRVYTLEGWPGFYKGLMPTLCISIILTFFRITVHGSKKPHHGRYSSPEAGILGKLTFSAFSLLLLPVGIITVRAITTPHKLPYFAPMYSLRVLLTPTERRRPWVLYLTPGLLAAQAAHILWVVLIMNPLRQTPRLKHANFSSLVDLSIVFALVLWSAAILTPLEVISLRLMCQRNHASDLSDEPEEPTEFAGSGEDVIGLRSETDPYLGLRDCATKILTEEGWEALYRAWWLTALGVLGSTV